MLFSILTSFIEQYSFLNVFKYLTFRTGLSVVTSSTPLDLGGRALRDTMQLEALAMANDSVYGLAASVWTDDLSQAHRVAGRLNVGTVSVNTVDALSPMTPFGGTKQSGYGRDLSLHSLDKYSALKTTWIKFKA